MITTIYFIILAYFALGGLGFYIINRRKDPQTARTNRIKYITYFCIINILFFSIIINPPVFYLLAVAIVITGFIELIRLYKNNHFAYTHFFLLSMLLYLLMSIGFLAFSRQQKELILFTFLVISVFDAFSQVSGQLAGSRKIFPSISPGKTFEGLLGGSLMALVGSMLLRDLLHLPVYQTLTITVGIIAFSFLGDMLASMYKRKYNAKDFSKILPGTGGFLDRFDSMIAAGMFMAIVELM